MRTEVFTGNIQDNNFHLIKLDPTDTVINAQLVQLAGYSGVDAVMALQQSNRSEVSSFTTMNIAGVAGETTLDTNDVQIERLDPVSTNFAGVQLTGNTSTGPYQLIVTIQAARTY